MEGRVFGETDSHVNMHVEDGVMTGNIHMPDDIYHIEVYRDIFLSCSY